MRGCLDLRLMLPPTWADFAHLVFTPYFGMIAPAHAVHFSAFLTCSFELIVIIPG